MPAPCDYVWDLDSTNPAIDDRIKEDSTNPWFAWDNRPFVSAEELLKVPMASQSTMLRMYSTIDPSVPAANVPNAYGLAELGTATTGPVANAIRWAVMNAPFGQMANVFATSSLGVAGLAAGAPADVVRDPATGVPTLDANGNVQPYGAPNFSRILDYVQVPSRYVGTDTMLNAETFNDVPTYVSASEPIGSDITGPNDPRYNFQPPFNKVSRERDPGKVNLNTVTGERLPPTSLDPVPRIWSDVFDGIMHRYEVLNTATNRRYGDMNPPGQLGQLGPAWRDVMLSRRGYRQVDALGASVDNLASNGAPDTMEFGLNNSFPTIFANPFRSADAGDLVPVPQMMQYGVDASMERVHPRTRGLLTDANGNKTIDPIWGGPTWPATYTPLNDVRDAGFGNDEISYRANNGIPNDNVTQRDILPLFSARRDDPYSDTNRNPYMMYEPMSRLGNLVTDRSGVFAVWITVGYFEVEKAPDWNTNENGVQDRMGGDINLYNRVYPDGYMLGKEVGSDTGDVKRARGFYIIDRTQPVGFKPGEDLNVEKMIRLRRRIE